MADREIELTLLSSSSSASSGASSSSGSVSKIEGAEQKAEVQDYAEIVVVRHGETVWNAEKRIQGHIDVALNDKGREQAVAVANRLAKEQKITAVYSSDLKRASHTAVIIESRCNVSTYIEDPKLRERHLGDLQGQIQLAPGSLRTDEEIPGGGESFDQLYQRCTSSLQNIGEKHIGERVVVVTHGGVLRAFHKFARPTVERPGKIKNASLSTFHLSGNGSWTIETWDDVSHLSAVGFLESGFGGDGTSG